MSARLKKSIQRSRHKAAITKARKRLASQTGTSYTLAKVKLSSKKGNKKYYHIYVK